MLINLNVEKGPSLVRGLAAETVVSMETACQICLDREVSISKSCVYPRARWGRKAHVLKFDFAVKSTMLGDHHLVLEIYFFNCF